MLELEASAIPLLAGARDLVEGNVPGGGRTNRQHFGPRVTIDGGVPADIAELLFDPQTSGGLLFAIEGRAVPEAVKVLADAGVPAVVIGKVAAAGEVLIRVR